MTQPLQELKAGQQFDVIEVFDEFDGARLFTARDDAGRTYLAVWVDETDASDVWLYVCVSEQRIEDLKTARVDLRSAFCESENQTVLQVSTDSAGRVVAIDTLPSSEVPSDWLPETGTML